MIWRYIPRAQATENAEKPVPSLPGPDQGITWDLCHEYEQLNTAAVIHIIELPAGPVVGLHGGSDQFCGSSSVLRPILVKLEASTNLSTRIVVLDGLLILAVCAQWWVIGYWLDRRHQPRRWTAPVVIITLAGALAAGSALGRTAVSAFIGRISVLAGALMWAVLIIMLAVKGVVLVRQRFSRQ